MWVITSQVDILMLGAYSNAENVGIYSVVIRFGLIVSFILTSINMVLAPKFAELFYSNKHDSLIKVAQKSSKLIFYTTVPIVVLFILFGKNILNFFGADFVPGYEALVLISLGQFINSICGSVGYFMNMTGHQSSFNKIIIVSTLINVILNWLLIPRWGVTGAAFSSLISTVFWNFGAALFIKFKFKSFIGYIPFTLGVKKHDQH
jgi:O-antigen/teichoic acid export membrane protein